MTENLLRHTEMSSMYSGRGGGMGRGGGDGGPKPVKVGDELDVTIEATASRGDGIAKKDGFVIFIKGAAMGQTVRIKVTEVRERFSVGEVIGAASATPAPSVPAQAEAQEQPQAENEDVPQA